MRIRPTIALLVFFGSYLPLSLILLAQDYDVRFLSYSICLNIWDSSCFVPLKNPYYSLSLCLICMFCAVVMWCSLKLARLNYEVEVVEVKSIDADVINYSLPYIASFMSVDYEVKTKLIGFFIFIVWMFVVTYRSRQIILNPMFIVLGWRPYEVSYKYVGGDGQIYSGVGLSGESLEVGKRYKIGHIQEVVIAVKS